MQKAEKRTQKKINKNYFLGFVWIHMTTAQFAITALEVNLSSV